MTTYDWIFLICISVSMAWGAGLVVGFYAGSKYAHNRLSRS
jgi:hypothetical protein